MGLAIMIIKAILFLSIGVSADILVQPGFGQPHPAVQSYASAPTPVVKQPSSAPVANNAYQLPSLPFGQPVAPYYLEVQPIYVDQSQAQSQIVGYPRWHQPHISPLPPRHLPHQFHYARIGGYNIMKPSVFVGQPQAPLAAHNRRRRSTDGGSASGRETAKAKNNDVAKDPTLTDTLSPITLAENQDNEHTKDLNDKYMEARQSKNDHDITGTTLLGLNPAKMRPDYHEYLSDDDSRQSQTRHVGSRHKSHHGSSEILGQQMRSQPVQTSVPVKENGDESVTVAPMNQQVGSATPNWRVITPEGQVLELVAAAPRNFPDPRPINPKAPKEKVVLQMAKPSEINSDGALNSEEIVGTSHHHHKHKLHALKHHHSLPMVAPPSAPPQLPTNYAQYNTPPTITSCSCPSNTPSSSYVILKNNADCYNGVQTSVQTNQPASPLYQLSYAPQNPSASYMILPQTNTPSNYGRNTYMTYYT